MASQEFSLCKNSDYQTRLDHSIISYPRLKTLGSEQFSCFIPNSCSQLENKRTLLPLTDSDQSVINSISKQDANGSQTPSSTYKISGCVNSLEKYKIGKNPKANRIRDRTSLSQREYLKAIYQKVRKPNSESRAIIAKKLGWPERSVRIWFQNMRQKDSSRTKAGFESIPNPDEDAFQAVFEASSILDRAASKVESKKKNILNHEIEKKMVTVGAINAGAKVEPSYEVKGSEGEFIKTEKPEPEPRVSLEGKSNWMNNPAKHQPFKTNVSSSPVPRMRQRHATWNCSRAQRKSQPYQNIPGSDRHPGMQKHPSPISTNFVNGTSVSSVLTRSAVTSASIALKKLLMAHRRMISDQSQVKHVYGPSNGNESDINFQLSNPVSCEQSTRRRFYTAPEQIISPNSHSQNYSMHSDPQIDTHVDDFVSINLDFLMESDVNYAQRLLAHSYFPSVSEYPAPVRNDSVSCPSMDAGIKSNISHPFQVSALKSSHNSKEEFAMHIGPQCNINTVNGHGPTIEGSKPFNFESSSQVLENPNTLDAMSNPIRPLTLDQEAVMELPFSQRDPQSKFSSSSDAIQSLFEESSNLITWRNPLSDSYCPKRNEVGEQKIPHSNLNLNLSETLESLSIHSPAIKEDCKQQTSFIINENQSNSLLKNQSNQITEGYNQSDPATLVSGNLEISQLLLEIAQQEIIPQPPISTDDSEDRYPSHPFIAEDDEPKQNNQQQRKFLENATGAHVKKSIEASPSYSRPPSPVLFSGPSSESKPKNDSFESLAADFQEDLMKNNISAGVEVDTRVPIDIESDPFLVPKNSDCGKGLVLDPDQIIAERFANNVEQILFYSDLASLNAATSQDSAIEILSGLQLLSSFS